MAHSKQKQKTARLNDERRLHNKSFRSSMRTAIRKVLAAVESKDLDAAKVALVAAHKSIDKCAKRNIIHPNNASRRVSALRRQVNALA